MSSTAEAVSLVPKEGVSASGSSAQSRVLRWLLTRGSWVYAILVLALSLAKYGAGLYPSWNKYQALALNWRDPHSSPLLQPPGDFRLADPVSAVVAAWLHLTGEHAFLGFHLVLAMCALVTPFALPAIRRTPELRLTVGLLIVGSAVPAILLVRSVHMIPCTLAAAAVAALALNPYVAAAGWGVFAFNNTPEALIALRCSLLSSSQIDAVAHCRGSGSELGIRGGIRRDSNSGMAMGWSNGPGCPQSLLWVESAYSNRRTFLAADLCFHLGRGMDLRHSSGRPVTSPGPSIHWSCISGSIALAFGLDDTRIIATVMWPGLLLVAVIVVRRLPRERVHELLSQFLPIALLMVIVIVWDDQLVYAGWGSLDHLLQYIFGHTLIPFQD